MTQKPHSPKHVKGKSRRFITQEGVKGLSKGGKLTAKATRKHRDEKKNLFINGYIKNFGNVSEVCRKMHIGRKSFYRWVKDDSEFKQAIEDADNGFLDMAEGQLRKKIKGGETVPILFYLKTKGKTRGYIEAQKHMLMGEEEGEPVQIQFIRGKKKEKKKEKEEEKEG